MFMPNRVIVLVSILMTFLKRPVTGDKGIVMSFWRKKEYWYVWIFIVLAYVLWKLFN